MTTLTAILYPDDGTDWLVANNPETGTTTQGKTVEEALANLKEAIKSYLFEFPLPKSKRTILTTFDMHPAHALTPSIAHGTIYFRYDGRL